MKPLPVECLTRLENHFIGDLDFSRLQSQLQVLSNMDSARDATCMTDIITSVRALGKHMSLILDVISLLRLYLCLPSSTASAERSFSTLRRIKTYLRSTMSQERLNHLMMTNCYKEQLDTIDMKVILKDFITRNDLRQKTFAIPL